MDDLSVASVCVQAFDESEGIEVAWNQVKVRASLWRTLLEDPPPRNTAASRRASPPTVLMPYVHTHCCYPPPRRSLAGERPGLLARGA